jgi:hypothetical protein
VISVTANRFLSPKLDALSVGILPACASVISTTSLAATSLNLLWLNFFYLTSIVLLVQGSTFNPYISITTNGLLSPKLNAFSIGILPASTSCIVFASLATASLLLRNLSVAKQHKCSKTNDFH